VTTTETTDLRIELLDPRALAAHPRNVRTDLGDLTGLTASIAAQGVLEPLSVLPIDDGHMILAGHRRAAAAIEAGHTHVPCLIRADLSVGDLLNADEPLSRTVAAEQVAAMLAENLHREGLTAVEEARGVQAMLDLGLPVERVAKRTGLDPKRVEKAAGVARLAPTAAAAVTVAGLTLDQAAVVARFEDDEEVLSELLEAAEDGPGEFQHAVERAEQTLAVAERVAAKRTELEAAGRTVVSDDGDATRLNWLLHNGEDLHAENHADCPGSAVTLSAVAWRTDVMVFEVCTDPAGNGHTDRYGPGSSSQSGKPTPANEAEEQAAREAAAAERRKVIENNKAMFAANRVRRAFVKELLARKSAPKEVLRFAVEEIAASSDALQSWLSGSHTQDADDAVRELGLVRPSRWRQTDASLTSGEKVSDARLPLQLLAHIAAADEGAVSKDSWRSEGTDRDRLVRWLTFLVGQGYTLSDVEQEIVDGAAK
jgi:ParB family chromosome partitioning protein